MEYVLIWLASAVLAATAATGKNRSAVWWFVVGFIFGPVGFIGSLVVSKLPERVNAPDPALAHNLPISDAFVDHAPVLPADSMACPRCAETIKRAAKVCRFCQLELPAAVAMAAAPSIAAKVDAPVQAVAAATTVTPWLYAALGVAAIAVVAVATRETPGQTGLLIQAAPPSVTPAAAPPPPPAAAARPWRVISTVKALRFVVVERSATMNRAFFEAAADEICAANQTCFVYFWDDPARAARAMPMSDAQLAALKAQYSNNPNTGFREMLVSCSVERGPKCLDL